MATDDTPATRRELDALVTRVNRIDDQGTRGTISAVSLVQAQLTEAIKDIAGLQAAMVAHNARHDRDQAAATSGRRWLIGTVIAIFAVMAAILAVIVPLALHRA